MSENTGKENSSKKGLIFIIVVFSVILVILVGVIAFLLGRNTNQNGIAPVSDNATETSDSNRKVVSSDRMVLDNDSAANIMDEMRKEVEEGMFECNMSMTWTFEDGTAKSSDAYVANSTNNKYPIYFDVELKDTGEVVYSSPVLPVGAQLTNFALDKDLDPGSYKARVVYYLISDEVSQEVVSSAAFVIKLNVNN